MADAPTPTDRARSRWRVLAWPGRYWARQSLRARITLLATALFALAVATGAVLLVLLQRYALVRVLDATAQKTAIDIARQVRKQPQIPNDTVYPTTGVSAVQVLDLNDNIVATSPGADRVTPALTPEQLDYAASDVLYLHRLRDVLAARLQRDGRMKEAEACFRFLPTRAKLDLMGWDEEDIFAHS